MKPINDKRTRWDYHDAKMIERQLGVDTHAETL
jgi:hypothetical protein